MVAQAVLFMVCADVSAQSLQLPLQFDFLNPGARSLALGSAFAGLADDATAAFTNPAGLTQLSRLEASFEFRLRRLETPFLTSGRLSGRVSNTGEDTFAGPVFEEGTDSTASLGFLSFVFPKSNWAFSAYTHELLNLNEQFQTRGVFQQTTFQGFPVDGREAPQEGSRDIRIRNYGASFAYEFPRGLAVGVGISAYSMRLDSLFRQFETTGFFGPPNFARETARATQDVDDIGFGGSVGLLWTINPKVRAGAVFATGPDFDFDITQRASPTSPDELSSGTFRVPNRFSLGLVVRPTDAVAITTEYTRVQYASLVDDFVTSQARANGRQDQFFIENGNELHAGVEYVFVTVPKTPAIRFGAWYDPDHSVQFRASSANDSFDERLGIALSQGEAVVHYTFGAGVSVSQRLEINGAGDITSRSRVFSASAVVRF